ncbi:MAG TPA: hypothetical protein VGC42_15100, partial [Kofleriaceae bacterium]
ARGAWFERPLIRGDLPLPLLGRWPLPTASSRRALWLAPLHAAGLGAALVAAATAAGHTLHRWPVAAPGSALADGLLVIYALGRARSERARSAWLAMHASCAAAGLLAVELVNLGHLGHAEPHLAALAAGYLVLGELTARSRHRLAPLASRATTASAIALALGPATILARPGELAMPLAGAVLAIAIVRRFQRAAGARPVSRPTVKSIVHSICASLAITWAAGLAVLCVLGRLAWLVPSSLAAGALAVTAALAAWGHWRLRARLVGAALGLASAWAAIAGVLALLACASASPATAPAHAATLLALLALGLAAGWFGFAAVRTGARGHGHAAVAALIAAYVGLRLAPLGAGITTDTDVIVAVVAAFVLHFASELLQRARLTALAGPAALAARALPLAACALAFAGGGTISTVRHAVLAETLGVLYTLSARRGDHPVLGALALAFYNAGLALLWICTHRHDALYYTLPVGVSIGLLARIYARHLSRAARRGLRAAGASLIYFSTYYYVVQFDRGLYPVLLGLLALAGVAVGFWLELRELFALGIGFLVLDVISNLAYYGAHRPVLGWTLLTLAGLLLTASGVVFQLRRAQIRALVEGVRASLARWD